MLRPRRYVEVFCCVHTFCDFKKIPRRLFFYFFARRTLRYQLCRASLVASGVSCVLVEPARTLVGVVRLTKRTFSFAVLAFSERPLRRRCREATSEAVSVCVSEAFAALQYLQYIQRARKMLPPTLDRVRTPSITRSQWRMRRHNAYAPSP